MADVLVVDDEPDIRELIAVRLARQGHHVLTAANADEALRVVEQHGEPDIAVLDLVMPDMSGLELLARLRACGCARMSAVLLTARCLRGDQEAARLLDAGYLRKPFAFADLDDVMRTELRPLQPC